MDAKERTELITALMGGILKKRGIDKLPFEDVVELRVTLTDETDRGCALMASAYIDHELGKLLRLHLVENKTVIDDLFGHNGPLGTFSSRINLAYSLGLIPADISRDLHLLRKIRNDFAHNPKKFGFEKPEIKSRCEELKFASPDRKNPRELFVTAMLGITGHIHAKALNVAHIEPSPEISTEKQHELFEQLLTEAIQSQEPDAGT